MNHMAQKFMQQVNALHAYQHALTILNYDAETAMPQAGAEGLADAIGYLSERRYDLLTEQGFLELAARLQQDERQPLYLRREAEELCRQGARLNAVSARDYAAHCALVSRAGAVWRQAKQNNDYQSFAPLLKKLIDSTKDMALAYAPDAPVYDTLLDEYDQGLNTVLLDDFFQRLKQAIVPLVASLAEQPAPDTSCLMGPFPIPEQRQLSRQLMELLGVDEKRCALGESEHPFTSETSNQDVRLTTHYYEDDLIGNIYSVIHESGHALYMLNTDDQLNQTSLAEGAGTSIHESQSRLCENMLGRSRAFISYLLPLLQKLFPAQFANIDSETLYCAINRCQPSLIRINADELTYPLHIIIRYELEKRLFSGDIEAEQLPELWNELYQQYLGLTPPDESRGILQDVHWSGGMFGYFPTYALGSAYAAQFMWAMEQELDVASLLSQGNFAPITNWLRQKVWRWGGIKKPAELLLEATGKEFDAQIYIDYLTEKFQA